MSITFRCIFAEKDRFSSFFLADGHNIVFVTRIYRKYNFSMYFLRKMIVRFPSKEKISCFWEKNTIFPDNTRKIMFQRNLFEKTISSGHLNKISYFHVFFFQKDHLSFSVQGIRSYFREKEMPSFPILQERSYFSAVFFGKTIFL